MVLFEDGRNLTVVFYVDEEEAVEQEVEVLRGME